ncbi:hypothetical protein G7Z17_g10435 [Cylindrodendrum hubeiense]|uniref:Uncharacterized protein n=1 Tax=Cylindrodendrum hubeiense TaxID=595255 RepID=A0A9P5GZI6_9HYPO|nr:hypothetical protein G7Z17_g10435 [Cylindrodendrum hubeiense]
MALSRFRLAATRPSLWKSHDSGSLSLAWSSRAAVAHARNVRSCRRSFHVAPILMPPLLFSGLFVALWCWKCTMMVLCQNMIIYNPFLPPDSRSLRIADFAKDCGGIQWREERIRSLDGTEIALCVSDVSPASHSGAVGRIKTPVYILYFQAQKYKERLPGVYMVEAGKDELVPADHGAGLHQRCEDVGLLVERRKVRGALHNEAMVKAEGKNAIAQSILLAVTRAQAPGLSLGSDSHEKSSGHGLS